LSTRLESTIDIAKDNYNKQSGRQFVETQVPSLQARGQSFAYLTTNHSAAYYLCRSEPVWRRLCLFQYIS
jgi:hypothetical protein